MHVRVPADLHGLGWPVLAALAALLIAGAAGARLP